MGHPPTTFGPLDTVTTPEPTYFWKVGQVGYWSGDTGPLNTVNPTSAYNQAGYDVVGYSSDAVAFYQNDVPNMPLPCYTGFYQGMAYYCVFTFHWAPYLHTEYGGFNWLTSEIYSTYVVDCKNQVCSPPINQ